MRRSLSLFLLLSGCRLASDPQPAAGSWRSDTPLPEARFESAAAASGGKILFLGGILGTGPAPAQVHESERVDVFDPRTHTWSVGPSLPHDGPHHHLAVAVVDDVLYLVGGFAGIDESTPTLVAVGRSYRLDGDHWTRIADSPVARGGATAQVLGGLVYLVGGGSDNTHSYASMSAYDPKTDRWSERAPMSAPRQHLASCVVDGKMIVVGGWDGEGKSSVPTAELYDPASDRWTRLPDVPTKRGGLGAEAIGSTCYVMGGEDWSLPQLPATYGVVEAFDLATGTWSTKRPMPTARHGMGVASFDGAIYTIGGGPSRGNSFTDVVEVFTP